MKPLKLLALLEEAHRSGHMSGKTEARHDYEAHIKRLVEQVECAEADLVNLRAHVGALIVERDQARGDLERLSDELVTARTEREKLQTALAEERVYNDNLRADVERLKAEKDWLQEENITHSYMSEFGEEGHRLARLVQLVEAMPVGYTLWHTRGDWHCAQGDGIAADGLQTAQEALEALGVTAPSHYAPPPHPDTVLLDHLEAMRGPGMGVTSRKMGRRGVHMDFVDCSVSMQTVRQAIAADMERKQAQDAAEGDGAQQ